MKCSTCFIIEPSFTLFAKVFLVIATILTILLYVITIASGTFCSTFIPPDISK
ncbi:MAG: hypothetical protein R2685_15915 [Candidatus Nitrosocosmicus sp.]|nr:hypothetical protein [Candidatus Nitrosocosmicus sp.]MDR4492359.1 hypothetical protein [Candidatus Nitrosocosmicus sp.]